MIKTKFTINLHILSLLAVNQEVWMSSQYIAGSLNINPVLVRKEIAVLKEGELIISKEGKNGGVKLARKPKEITLSDVFNLVKGKSNVLSLSNNTPNPKCKIGKSINSNMSEILDNVDKSISKELKKETLQTFVRKF